MFLLFWCKREGKFLTSPSSRFARLRMQEEGSASQQHAPVSVPASILKQPAKCCQVSVAAGKDIHTLFTSVTLHIQPVLSNAIANYFGESQHFDRDGQQL